MLMKPKFFYDHTTKQALGFQNPLYLKKAQQLEPKLYDGNFIKNTSAIVIPDSKKTLVLAEESRSKMLLKQQDPMMLEKKNSIYSSDPTPSCRPTKVEVSKELPKVSMVNTSLKKLKHHLAGFDVVIKERTTATAITEGSWGFEHTKACFRNEIIPFVKALKDLFNKFDQYLIDELSEVLNENERLLEQVINKDIVNIIVNSSVDNAYVNVHECEKCLKLETELLNKMNFVEKEIYDKLFRRVKPSTSASGSQPSGNTKKDKIQQTPSSTQKNKVRSPTQDRKVFTKIGYTWRPTGQTFTIVGNACPLTRITTTAEVPLRKPTALGNCTPKPDLLFQLLFDELLNPPSSVDCPAPKVIAPIAEVKENHDLYVAHMNNDPFFGILIPENDSKASSSLDIIPTVVHTDAPNLEHVTKWTKDHPLENIISELERPVSTRLQLHEQALFCYYDAFLTSVELKNYKDALTQACWIEAIQEELNEFKCLKVWELVPCPDKVMVITLK
ncbi:hypothetical protein Tco_1094726 [Tanacetum coccineum]|uniref:Integrase, catalytic region, zinc finger, CCHC-type, peptidase aspartic, catalytic n=1 Tax=Tanacetum coccineum TaxID=301880 RepID=A0ABQ5IGJ6_9ASTR